jgi:hypothetical protein
VAAENRKGAMVFWVGIVLAGLIALIPWATDLRGKWKHIVLGLEIVALAVAISGHMSDVRQTEIIAGLQTQAIPATERKSLEAARTMEFMNAGGGL